MSVVVSVAVLVKVESPSAKATAEPPRPATRIEARILSSLTFVGIEREYRVSKREYGRDQDAILKVG